MRFRPCFFLFLLLSVLLVSFVASNDDKDDCTSWASMGECDTNPEYMLEHCATACAALQADRDRLQHTFQHTSFYDLSANDIDGKKVDFETLRNKVVIVTNVASYCGYTESHYRGLVELWSSVSSGGGGGDDDKKDVTILAFPCNQFGRQEPGSNNEIKQFAKRKGVTFTMMDKVNVNGQDAHQVFQFLKYKTDTATIGWNFAVYFVVAPDGTITAHEGVEPMDLKEDVLQLLKNDEL